MKTLETVKIEYEEDVNCILIPRGRNAFEMIEPPDIIGKKKFIMIAYYINTTNRGLIAFVYDINSNSWELGAD